MSSLTPMEMLHIRKYLEMGDGHVLGFTRRELGDFILEKTGLYFGDEKYNKVNASKAKRLEKFFKVESDRIVAKLLYDFVQYKKKFNNEDELKNEIMKIVLRLKGDFMIQNFSAIKPIAEDMDSKILVESILEALHNNKPELALDRLHTYLVKYIRHLCSNHRISYDKKPLHSIFGEYVKKLKKDGSIQSNMTELIFKKTISVLEEFNKVRNDKTFAHDNELLNYNESMFLCNNVINIIAFIQSIE